MIAKDFILRVKENLGEKQKGPYCIDLVINDFCNLSCFYCSGSINRSHKSKLSKKALTKILNSAKNLYVQEISLTSLIGEPTIFKNIKFLMEEIKKRNFIGTLLTNGTQLDLDFARFMKKIRWDVLIISLDSFNPAIQYRLRPSVGGDNYLENIIKFLDFTAQNNPTLNLNFNMVVSNLNYDDVENYFKQVELCKAKNITLVKMVKMTNYYKQFLLTGSQLKDFKCRLKNMATSVNFNRLEWLDEDCCLSQQNESAKIGLEGRKKCYFHLYKLLINCDGQILKCNGDPQETFFNVYNEDLHDSYFKLIETHKHLIKDAPCWDICCSPIKVLNQEINYNLKHNILDGRKVVQK